VKGKATQTTGMIRGVADPELDKAELQRDCIMIDELDPCGTKVVLEETPFDLVSSLA